MASQSSPFGQTAADKRKDILSQGIDGQPIVNKTLEQLGIGGGQAAAAPAPHEASTGGGLFGGIANAGSRILSSLTGGLGDIAAQGQADAANASAAGGTGAAPLGTYRADIAGKLDNYNNLFNSIYGKIDTAAADQSNTTKNNYATQRTDLTADYNQQVPGIDMSYYLGGVGDSSLRLAGQGKAEQALKSSIGKVDANEATDLANIGQQIAQKRAGYQADQSSIDSIRALANQSTDAAELQSLQRDLQTKIAGLTADSAGFDTGGQYRKQLAALAPTQNLDPIKQTLNSLVQGAANPALKRQLAQQIIDNSGVTDAQKQDLFQQYVNTVA